MKTSTRLLLAGTTLFTAISALVVPASPAAAASSLPPINGLASVAVNGKTGAKASTQPSLSNQGRFIAFTSSAADLVPVDGNNKTDVFVRDTLAGTTTLVSISTGGVQGDGDSDQPSISPNGRWVAFRSQAKNLVSGDTNGVGDIFVRDLVTKTTVRANLKSLGGQATGGGSGRPDISSDGTSVLFESSAKLLVAGDANNVTDVFVHSFASGTTERISVDSSELGLSAGGAHPAMSGDARFVVFDSDTTQIPNDTNGKTDVFLRDRLQGLTLRQSATWNGAPPNGPSRFATVSDDGNFVAFQSAATNFVTVPMPVGKESVFFHDRSAGVTILMPQSPNPWPANGTSSGPAMSADGTQIAYSSDSSDIVAGDTNGVKDIFVWDLGYQTNRRVSTKTSGAEDHGHSAVAAISPDGHVIAYESLATDGFSPDANGATDIFWRGTYQLGPFVGVLQMIQQFGQDFTGSPLPLGTLVELSDSVLYGTRSSARVITDLAHGGFDDHRGPVIRLYWAFFGRLPDQGGLDYWVKKHRTGTTLKAIANSFAKSSEFVNHYGLLSDTAFVTLVYQNVLERNPDPAGLAYWIDRIQHGVTRGEMMTGFSESSEGVRKMRGEVDAVLLYAGMLGRLPTKGEFTNTVSLLESGASQPSEVFALMVLTSGPYAARFS